MVTSETLPGDKRIASSVLEAGTAPEDRSFRPDVQGLRAVAVLLVVLYHAHVPGLGGGYVGVDVFFVISGFVISGVLLRERTSTGGTSISSFYARRARRIIPAATLVIIAAVIVSYGFLGPIAGNATARDARWASVFLINVHFAELGTNYLSSLNPPSALQNFWSLAVEEQFYLVYPAVFLAVGTLSTRGTLRRRLGVVLVLAIIVSLALSIIQTHTNPATAYFSVVPRIWELSLGGLVAITTIELKRLSAATAAVMTWLGLGTTIAAGCFFTASTAYPGGAVIIPAAGAALILAGGAAVPRYGVEILLRIRPFQWIGLISYSLYLWHWPILTLAAEQRGTANLPALESTVCLLLSLILASLTYLLIENPVRRSKIFGARRWCALLMAVILIVSGLVLSTTEIHLHNLGTLATPDIANLTTGDGCPVSKSEVSSLLGVGVTPSRTTNARVLVVGDSTACTMVPGLAAVGAPLGIQVENATVIGCGVVSGRLAPRFVDGRNVNAPTALCQSRADAALKAALKSGKPNVVLWSSTWERSSLVVGTGSHKRLLRKGSSQWYRYLTQRMSDRVDQFVKMGATVVIVTQPPFTDPGAPKRPTVSDDDFLRLNALLTEFAQNRPHVRAVNLASYVCPSGPPCPLVVDHIDARGEGSLWVARWLLPQIGVEAPGAVQSASLPEMRVLSPKNGAVLRGESPLLALAAYTVGVTRIEFEVTGGALHNALLGPTSPTSVGWVYRWDTASVPNGTYTIRSVALNAAGKSSRSRPVTISVSNGKRGGG
jgi:peptidoglycan/LPS O-acetylase OafA/YrhL